ncbi:MAG: PAS domain-containing protein [Candidatus Eremiobacteraeota bacterium]|nr:PAS domain-containing protein [Candidatus Eremiobacteraeota bacterium]
MKFNWQTDTNLGLTVLSPQLRIHLKLDLSPNPLTACQIVGPDSPHDFGIIAHEWALQGERVTFEVSWSGLDYCVTVEPLFAPDGTVAGVSGSAQLLSDKVAAARRSSMSAHAETVAACGSWYYDARSGEYEWSDGLYELLGVDVWMPFSRNIRDYDASQDAQAVELAVSHARLTHEPYSIDHRVQRVDGVVRFVQERAAFFFDETGLLTHVIGTLHDITSRKAGESRLAYLAYHNPLSGRRGNLGVPA